MGKEIKDNVSNKVEQGKSNLGEAKEKISEYLASKKNKEIQNEEVEETSTEEIEEE